ncbi:glycosyltransferase family 2 protein [Paenibacillus sp. MWE-103]|uniref:Glycosyltransferase family 2 protein n=1 Tax=Paenibacillus artemisiicola TaxID=1172618 RepID=A0ABS3W3J2_9BACL|nr:glycosyltransferase family 2 protein [Paenibacillus artemisiicola]
MENPLVSVVIPAYNRPHTLRIALDSALGQTHANLEVVICDDSSNDGVQEMIGDYLRADSRVRYYRNERNLFVGNWHKGFDLAKGDYINYLMDDDVFHPEKLERMLRFYRDFGDIALVTSYRQTINAAGQALPPLQATARLYGESRIMAGQALADYAMSRCLNVIGEPTTVLFRKADLADKFGVFGGKQYTLLNDMAAWLHLLGKGRAVYMPEALSYFRLHPNQNNQTLGRTAFAEWLDLAVAARANGFLRDDAAYRSALEAFLGRIRGSAAFGEDAARAGEILRELD